MWIGVGLFILAILLYNTMLYFLSNASNWFENLLESFTLVTFIVLMCLVLFVIYEKLVERFETPEAYEVPVSLFDLTQSRNYIT